MRKNRQFSKVRKRGRAGVTYRMNDGTAENWRNRKLIAQGEQALQFQLQGYPEAEEGRSLSKEQLDKQ